MGINNLLKKPTKKKTSDISLKIGNTMVNNQKTVANHFNQFFTGVAQNLVNRLGNTSKKFTDYLPNRQSNSLFINPVSEFEVSDQISSLDAKKSADAYDIPIEDTFWANFEKKLDFLDFSYPMFSNSKFHLF